MKLASENFDDSRARRLYGEEFKEEDGSYFYGPSDYNPIVRSFGEVLVQVDDSDYQGDTRVLLKKDGRFGFLNFGWGSCSGCDALQSCSSFRDIETLIQGMERDIKWFDSLAEAKSYIGDDAARESSYYYHEGEWARFKAQVLALVG